MTMSRIFSMLILVCVSTFTFATSRAVAATVTAYTNNVMSCFLKLDGPIESGDAAKISTALKEYKSVQIKADSDKNMPNVPRICLHSEGGSYGAAFEIINQLYGQFGTAVTSGGRCEGPCALLFMAGASGDGGTVDSRLGGRIVHPFAELSFGGAHSDEIDVLTAAKLVALQERLSMDPSIILAILQANGKKTLVETVGQAAKWQIRVGPVVTPGKLTPLSIWTACENMRGLVERRLLFLGDAPRDEWDYRRHDPVVQPNQWGSQRGTAEMKLNAYPSECEVIYYGATDDTAPTDEVGYVSFALKSSETFELVFTVYGSEFFTGSTPISALIRDKETVPQSVLVSDRNWAITSVDRGLCAMIENETLTWSAECLREDRETPAEDMTSIVVTTLDSGSGIVPEATMTTEYRRGWPDGFEPEFTFDGKPITFWGDGMPDEGDEAGNEPGADAACRVFSDGASQWCPTDFWHDEATGMTFLYISKGGLEQSLVFSSD